MERSISRVAPGASFPVLTLTTIAGDAIRVPTSDKVTHLQFRRFAGCPICNLHLRSVTTRLDELDSNGVREVVVFHSTDQELLKYEDDLPFAVVADPQRNLYKRFGVEASPRSVLRPGAWKALPRGWANIIRRAIAGRRAPLPIKPNGGNLGLPADILVGPDGTVIAVKYGEHAYDQWSVDEIIGHATAAG